jgi:hypothetical protein
MADFLPKRDADMAGWSASFLAKIEDWREELGFSQQTVDDYRALHEAFRTALAESLPGTRSRSTTTRKNADRARLKAEARRLALLI